MSNPDPVPPVPPTPPKHESRRPDAPFWWPDERGFIVIGLFALTGYILYRAGPHGSEQPSEFFKAIGQAVVLTGFLAAVGFFFQASKGASEANSRADKALGLVTPPTPPPSTTTTTTTQGVPTKTTVEPPPSEPSEPIVEPEALPVEETSYERRPI